MNNGNAIAVHSTNEINNNTTNSCNIVIMPGRHKKLQEEAMIGIGKKL